jgi:hypothetical protein
MTHINEYKKLWQETNPTISVEELWDALGIDSIIREAIQRREEKTYVEIVKRYRNIFEEMCNQNDILFVPSFIDKEAKTIVYSITGWAEDVKESKKYYIGESGITE